MGISEDIYRLATCNDNEFKEEFIPILDSETYMRTLVTDDSIVMTVTEICSTYEQWCEQLAQPHKMAFVEVPWLRDQLTISCQSRHTLLDRELLHFENLTLVDRQRSIDHVRSLT